MDNISVVIRNRNEERYIGYAIQSVLDTFKKPEIIVVDNNSTDNSMGIVNTFDFEDFKLWYNEMF
jgi:glycosyltransferase involved in cell wall biosynthesis